MEEPGYRQLIADMIATPKRQAEYAAQGSEAKPILKENEQAANEKKKRLTSDEAPQHVDSDLETTPEMPKEKVTLAVTKQDDKKERELKSQEQEKRRQREKREQQKKAEQERRMREQQEALKRIEAMLLHDYEEQFIKALFPFISTPRLAKRFLNNYRLIRVQAASRKEDFEIFINPAHGEYRAVLILLAIVVGRAEVAPEILNDLAIGKSKKFTTWLENTYIKYEKTRLQLNTETNAEVQKAGAIGPLLEGENQLRDLRKAASGISKDIKTVITALKDLNGPSFEDRIETYRKWSCEVGRYSFRWHLEMDT